MLLLLWLGSIDPEITLDVLGVKSEALNITSPVALTFMCGGEKSKSNLLFTRTFIQTPTFIQSHIHRFMSIELRLDLWNYAFVKFLKPGQLLG